MGHRLRTTLILILAFCATLVVSSITFGALAPTLDPGDAEGPWYSAMSTGNPMLDLVILLVFGIPFGMALRSRSDVWLPLRR
ncbi:hypothetical protein Q8F55_006163 [Vanrija albida]|uniref:Uncharacterized protein n=1 Tax=Vanrija albida TaxID=181172 RepID=A0ABR3PWF6_9TREE